MADPQTQTQTTDRERVYLGEGAPFPEGVQRDYYVLIPTDGDIDQRTLSKSMIADVLRRNGRVVDDLTLDKINELWKMPDGGYDFLKMEKGARVSTLPAQDWPGVAPTGKAPDGTIHGYSLFADMQFQQKVLSQATQVQGPPLDTMDDETLAQMTEVIKNLSLLVKASGNDAASKPLEAIVQAMEAKDLDKVDALLKSTSSAGNATAALFEGFKLMNEKGLGADNKGVMEQIQKLTSPSGVQKMDAVEGLARFAKVFAVPGDAAGIYFDTYKLAKGVDEQGKPLTGTQRVETLTSLASNTASFTAGGTELAGALAERYGYKALAGGLGTVSGYAAAGAFGLNIAAVQVAAMKVVIDGVGEMKTSIANKDIGDLLLRNKGGTGPVLERLVAEQQQVQGFPGTGVNAYSTARRLIESFPGTKGEVWENYLKKAIDPPGLTERVFSARNQNELKANVSQEDIERFVKGVKEARANFIEATTRGVVNRLNTSGPYDRDGDILKDVKPTSLSPETIERKRQEQKELDSNPLIPKTKPFKLEVPGGDVPPNNGVKEDKAAKVPAGENFLLSDPAHPKNEMFRKLLGSMQDIDRSQNRPSDQGTTQAAGALTSASVRAGVDADRAVLGTDARNLFAVQGEGTSPGNNRVGVPTVQAVNQPLEVSTAQVNAALAAKQATESPTQVQEMQRRSSLT